jgi:hypothetical protein
MTVIDKLQAKGLGTALVLNAPKEAAGMLKDIGSAMELATARGKGSYDLVLAFVQDSVEFAAALEKVRVIMIDAARLWFAYPKKGSKLRETDLSADSGWTTMKTLGYSSLKQISLDADWSALRFVHNSAKD